MLTSSSQSSASAPASVSASASASASASPSTSTSTSASIAPSASSSNDDTTVGAPLADGLLRPYMGLLPLAQPNDPWTRKPYDLHYPLYSGGGSYEPYLRPRRDTHIMGRSQQLLTPGMLERLLRIKAEFQKQFPHLYQGMLNHHTNRTRVVVTPPLLVRLNRTNDSGAPVYELGAAERGIFDEVGEEEQEEEGRVSMERSTTERNKSNGRKARKDDLDDDVDYFHFEDEDEDVDNDNDPDNFDD